MRLPSAVVRSAVKPSPSRSREFVAVMAIAIFVAVAASGCRQPLKQVHFDHASSINARNSAHSACGRVLLTGISSPFPNSAIGIILIQTDAGRGLIRQIHP